MFISIVAQGKHCTGNAIEELSCSLIARAVTASDVTCSNQDWIRTGGAACYEEAGNGNYESDS
jgi:hypothetical protein